MIHILLLGQPCSRTPGDYTRAAGRCEKPKIHEGARKRKWESTNRTKRAQEQKKFKRLLPYDFLRPKPIPQNNGGRTSGIKNRSPNDPARQGGPGDNRAAGTQLSYPLTAREIRAFKNLFFDTACPFRFSIGKIEAGRFSMAQMKLAGVTGRCYLGLDYVSVTVFRMNPQNE
jgi:hypothetical protein